MASAVSPVTILGGIFELLESKKYKPAVLGDLIKFEIGDDMICTRR